MRDSAQPFLEVLKLVQHLKLRQIGLSLAMCVVGGQVVLAAEIWLGGHLPPVQHGPSSVVPSDYLDIFQLGAPWPTAASHVSVLKMPTRFFLDASDEELTLMFNDLKRRHIAAAIELGVLAGDGCGNQVEGFAYPTTATTIARRVKKVGGELGYVALDEQLYYGHQYDGPHACHFTIADVAAQVAARMKEMRRYLPNVQVGDIEPIGSTNAEQAVRDIMDWVAAFREAMGEPLAFVHADIQWNLPWRSELELLIRRLRQEHVKVGIIYNGGSEDIAGEQWTHHAEQRFVAIETDPALVPDQAILQTWMPQPEHMLPETSPGTMTYLVNRYLALPSILSLRQSGSSLTGRLTSADGQPMVRATVQVEAVARASADVPVIRKLSGTVPVGAETATIALRINNECGCSGAADVAIGTVSYRDERTGQTVLRHFTAVAGSAGGNARFLASASQKIAQNTSVFPVTPGNPFIVQIPLSVSYESGHSGGVAIIFLDHTGKGILRTWLPFEPNEKRVGKAVTDAQGNFSVPLDTGLASSGANFLAKFEGNDRFRLSSVLLQ